jgi:hypothetical protein
VQENYTNIQIASMKCTEVGQKPVTPADVSIFKQAGKMLCTGRRHGDSTMNTLVTSTDHWHVDKSEPCGTSLAYQCLYEDSEKSRKQRLFSLTLIRLPLLKLTVPPQCIDSGMSMLVRGYRENFEDDYTQVHSKKHVMPGCTGGVCKALGWIEFWKVRAYSGAVCNYLRRFVSEYQAASALGDVDRDRFVQAAEKRMRGIIEGHMDAQIGELLGFFAEDYRVYLVGIGYPGRLISVDLQ